MLVNIIKDLDKSYDGAIAFLFEGEELTLPTKFNEQLAFVKKAMEKEEFTGKIEKKLNLTLNLDGEVFELTMVGLGKKDKLDGFSLRKAIFPAVKELKNKSLIVFAEGIEFPKALLETLLIADYKFDKYKSKSKQEDDKKDEEGSIDVFGNYTAKDLDEAKILVEGIKITRDLVNEPANIIYPETLADKAIEYGKEYGFEVEVFGDEKIKELGMKAFAEVARAAAARPRVIVIRHMGGNEGDEILGLVGKGLTYDTGGLSLKPSTSMDTMKSDMGGAATVIGAMTAIAKLGIKKNIVAVIAACENSIGGNAYRPGDIIESMAGKTIEVLNTDAEGRLTLVDAVHYILDVEKADKVLDIATLTGAALVCLGTTTTACLSNNDEFYKKIEEAASESDERLWRLPTFPEYGKLIESKVADLKNIGGRWAGTITAGMFIEKFVQEKPWIHLDIAGSSWTDAPYDYYTYGGTAQMVRTLVNFAKK